VHDFYYHVDLVTLTFDLLFQIVYRLWHSAKFKVLVEVTAHFLSEHYVYVALSWLLKLTDK